MKCAFIKVHRLIVLSEACAVDRQFIQIDVMRGYNYHSEIELSKTNVKLNSSNKLEKKEERSLDAINCMMICAK